MLSINAQKNIPRTRDQTKDAFSLVNTASQIQKLRARMRAYRERMPDTCKLHFPSTVVMVVVLCV
jgi:hypothetical protein